MLLWNAGLVSLMYDYTVGKITGFLLLWEPAYREALGSGDV